MVCFRFQLFIHLNTFTLTCKKTVVKLPVAISRYIFSLFSWPKKQTKENKTKQNKNKRPFKNKDHLKERPTIAFATYYIWSRILGRLQYELNKVP